jgi:hypothetical protein
VTPETRVGVLVGLLERVWRNAREPRPTFLEFWDRPAGKRPSRPRPQRPAPAPPLEEPVERFLREDTPPATTPPPTAPGRERDALLTFGDESTQTGDPVEAERLILLEQEAARQDRVEPLLSAPEPPAPLLFAPEPRGSSTRPRPAAKDVEDSDAVSLVIDDFDLAGPATIPPSALASPMIDIEAIENDALDIPDPGLDSEPEPEPFVRADPRATITNELALERARAESIRPSDRMALPEVEEEIEEEVDMESLPPSAPTPARLPSPPAPLPPPPPVSSLELKDDDDVPSSVRKPVTLDRPVDDAFDGFGPVAPASEPPPESGEVPSQRRLLTPPAVDVVKADAEVDASTAGAALEVSPTLADLGAGLPRLGSDEDDDDDFAGQTKLFRKSERPFAEDVERVEAEADSARAEQDEDEDEDEDYEHAVEEGEYEATKEIRTMGRVDVVERQPIAASDVIMLSEPRQKTAATFGELLDLALSIGS